MIKGILTFLAITVFLVICSTSLLLKTKVTKLEKDIASLNQNIGDNKMAIHILKAEWAHLNEPERIRYLAEKHMRLKPIKASQVKGYDIFYDNNQNNFKKVSY
ncbi:MAG: Cell division protein FtsL [Alphaproteobacteria bacterium ADurb.Bin438]|nr:MAG: Cell division protein FtsL [Alphaproteobacteria bacterium ADurb.Bin438]